LESAEVFVDGDWVESKDQDPNGDVCLIQLADVGDGEYFNKSARFLTTSKARALKCTFLKEGDVLIARMPDPLGRACIFPADPKPTVTVVDICIVRPGRSRARSSVVNALPKLVEMPQSNSCVCYGHTSIANFAEQSCQG
jgi:type I restriction enzyme S subunit